MSQSQSSSRTRTLVECALLIAIGIVLGKITFFSMPYGGSVTFFSALPFVLISFRHGIKWGLLSGFVNGMIGVITGFYAPSKLYPGGGWDAPAGLPFGVHGAGAWPVLFAKPFKNRLIGVGVGTRSSPPFCGLCAASFRVGCSRGSYQSDYEWAIGLPTWAYSLIYNASYMIPETILTAVAAVILCKFAPKLFNHVGEPLKASVRVKRGKVTPIQIKCPACYEQTGHF